MSNNHLDQNDVAISFEELFFLLRKHRKMVSFIFISCIMLSMFLVFVSLPKYQSKTTIFIEDDANKNNPLFAMSLRREFNTIDNEIEILKSVTIATKTVERLMESEQKDNLHLLYTRNENLDLLNLPQQAVRKIFLQERPDYKTLENALAKKPNLKSSAIRNILLGIQIEKTRNTDVLKIAYTAYNPFEASTILNTFVQAYIENDLDWENSIHSHLQEFLSVQLDRTGIELTSIEEKLRLFQENNKIFSIDDNSRLLLEKLQVVEGNFYEADSEIQIYDKRIELYEDILSKEEIDFADKIINTVDAQLISLRSELASLQSDFITTKAKSGSENALKLLSIKIDNLKKAINKETKQLVSSELLSSNPILYRQEIVDSLIQLNTEKKELILKKNQLSDVLNIYEKKLELLPDQFLKFSQLQRDKNIIDNTYILMKTEFEESRVAEASTISKIRIIDPALPNTGKISPRSYPTSIAIGFILGIIVSIMFILYKKISNTKITDTDELERKGLSIVSMIPAFSDKELMVQRSNQLIVERQTRSPISEAYRTLRTSLSFSINYDKERKEGKTILISSSGPQEGKSTTAANLAVTYALAGKKTILVDADMRKPVMHKIFEMNKSNGMSKLFVGSDLKLKDVIEKSRVKNLEVLCCGPIPPNPSEILGSDKLQSILQDLKKTYDVVIFDTPPIIAVTDAILLRPNFDQFVLIIRAGATERAALDRTMKSMAQIGFPVKSCVLNEVSNMTSYGGQYSYNYNYYQYYYAEDDAVSEKKNSE